MSFDVLDTSYMSERLILIDFELINDKLIRLRYIFYTQYLSFISIVNAIIEQKRN